MYSFKKITQSLLTSGAMVLMALSFSCDDGVDPNDINQAPEIKIDGKKISADGEYTGRVRYVSGKDTEYTVTVEATDENENIEDFMLLSKDESIRVFRGSTELDFSKGYTFSKKQGVSYTDVFKMTLNKVGEYTVSFKVKDSFGVEVTVNIKISVLGNVLPIAKLSYSEGSLTKGEYILDGSASVDGDADLGGTIIGYIFSFDGKTIETNKSEVRYIFSNPGTYPVSLVVIDNNDARSSEVKIDLNVE